MKFIRLLKPTLIKSMDWALNFKIESMGAIWTQLGAPSKIVGI